MLFPALASAQQRPANTAPIDTSSWRGLEWRLLGPAHTGRMTSVVGTSQRPEEYYVGTTGGGVWKTTDAGKTWNPMTDDYFGGTIGAVDVFKGNPDIVWAGGGETPIRGNVSHGDGVWKSADAGKTWTYMGLARDAVHLAAWSPTPPIPNIVYVGALGHVFAPNPERGVYRTRDGGKTWQKILFKNDSTGVADLVMDPTNPNVLYAGFWQAGRKPWLLVSGGAGSGLWKTTDGGDHWTEITRAPGLPAGNLGRHRHRDFAREAQPRLGVDRSRLGRRVPLRRRRRHLAVHQRRSQPAAARVVLQQDLRRPEGHQHDLWRATSAASCRTTAARPSSPVSATATPTTTGSTRPIPKRIAVAGDPGVVLTTDGGKTTTRANIPTGQYYHVHLTNAAPYDVCGAEQDGGVDCFPVRDANAGRGGRGGGAAPGGGRGGAAPATPPSQWNFTTRYGGAGGESGYVASDPLDPDVTFGGNYSGVLEMQNHRTGQSERLDPWPLNPMGHDAQDSKYRFQWTYPIMNSPNDPKVLYVGSNVLFRSNDLGQSWKIVSPDLTRHDPGNARRFGRSAHQGPDQRRVLRHHLRRAGVAGHAGTGVDRIGRRTDLSSPGT